MYKGILKYGIESFVMVLVFGSLLGLQVIPANGPKTEIMDADGDTKIQVEESADEDIIRIDTAGVERITVDASGHTSFLAGDVFVANGNGLIIGHTAKITASNTSEFQVLGTSGADASQVFARFSGDDKGPQFNFLKSRSPTIGVTSIVLNNDMIGQFKFLPDDGADFSTKAALFYAEVDDPSPAPGDIGAAFVWEQMPGAAGALRETMRLAANGTLKLSSTIGAFIPNLLTTTQRDALTGINGMLFYNSTLDRGQLREGGAWASLVTPGSTDTFTNKTFDANATGNSLSNVDVADLANGTAGNMFTYDSGGNPAVVATGTSGQVLKSNGAGAAPTFQAVGGSATKEFFVVCHLLNQVLDDWVHVNLSSTASIFFTFVVPNDFTSLTDAVVLIIPDATETVQWDLDASVAAVGEDYNSDTRQTLNQTKSVTVNDMTELDISGQLTGLAANDYVSVNFQSDTSTLRVIGMRFRYN